jgi:hypothetical protein
MAYLFLLEFITANNIIEKIKKKWQYTTRDLRVKPSHTHTHTIIYSTG